MSGLSPATRTVADLESETDPTSAYQEVVQRAMKELGVTHAQMQGTADALRVFKRARELSPSAAGAYQRFVMSEER
jgi:hypothetical protein